MGEFLASVSASCIAHWIPAKESLPNWSERCETHKAGRMDAWQQLVTELHQSNTQSRAAYHIIETMAPVGLVSSLSLFSSPEVGIISLVAFLVLSITLLALCARCNRGSGGNAYTVKGSEPDGVAANGTANTKSGGPSDADTTLSWKAHNNMPPNTLPRSKAYTQ